MGSASAKVLAHNLDGFRVKKDGKYRPRMTDTIINWGNSKKPAWESKLSTSHVILNNPQNVAKATNKLLTFETLKDSGLATVEYTTEKTIADEWLNEGDTVFARTLLNSYGGKGVVVCKNNCVLPRARLYTKGMENNGEYRVHVFNGVIIDYVKKRRLRGETPNIKQIEIKNKANGWIFMRGHLKRLKKIESLAIKAVSSLGLDFGAVDIIKDKKNNVYVLEINTACGMSGTTIINYTNAIKLWKKEQE